MIHNILVYLYKVFKGGLNKIRKPLDKLLTKSVFYINKVSVKSFTTNGVPLVNVSLNGVCVIGEKFVMNNREIANPIGRFRHCSIIVSNFGQLIIGNNVGMSSTAIVCHKKIIIGDNVRIGGNVTIYDTDFHSLKAEYRLNRETDVLHTKTKQVNICDNSFIGAHSTILKGVTIGENSIVGACSVVTRNIPPNEIWAGNPAKKIKNI